MRDWGDGTLVLAPDEYLDYRQPGWKGLEQEGLIRFQRWTYDRAGVEVGRAVVVARQCLGVRAYLLERVVTTNVTEGGGPGGGR